MEPSNEAALAEYIAVGFRLVDVNLLLAFTNVTVSTLRILRAAGITDALALHASLEGNADATPMPSIAAGQRAALREWVAGLERQFAEEFAVLRDPERARSSILEALTGPDQGAAEPLLSLLDAPEVHEVAAVRLRLYSNGEAQYDSDRRFSALYLRLCEWGEVRRPGLFGPASARGNIAALAALRVRRGVRAGQMSPDWPAPAIVRALRDVRDRAAVYKPGAWRSPPLPLLALAARVLLSSPEVGLPEECREAWAALLKEYDIHPA